MTVSQHYSIQNRIDNFIDEKGISYEKLCIISDISKKELEDLFSKRLVSLDNIILNKVLKGICLTHDELFRTKIKKNTGIKQRDRYKCKELLTSFKDINIDILSDSVAEVDKIISSEGKKIPTNQRVMAYLAFYEIANTFIRK